MKTRLLLLMLLALFAGGLEAAPTRISYWVSTFYTDGTYSNYLAISGHTTEGDGPGSAVGVSIMPVGAFTKLTVNTFDPGTPGFTRTATLIKNGSSTAATCTVPNGSFTCVWTGSVAFADGDLANIQITGGGGITVKAPWSIMTVFTVGADDWPWNV